MALRRSTTLTSSLEFERVYREGSVYGGKLFSVHVLPNGLGEPRLGLSVSKKVGSAVTRNGVRRRLKEIFRSSQGILPDDLDLVVSARPAAAEASYQELDDEFSRSLSKITKNKGSREGV